MKLPTAEGPAPQLTQMSTAQRVKIGYSICAAKRGVLQSKFHLSFTKQ